MDEEQVSSKPTKRSRPRCSGKGQTREAKNNFRRLEIVNALPSHQWSITKAAISLGYSESYARTILPRICKDDPEFLLAVEAKKKEVQDFAPWNLEELQLQYRKLLKDCEESSDRTNAKGCLDSLTRIQGGFRDRLETEDANETRRLSQKQQDEAREIARLRLRTA